MLGAVICVGYWRTHQPPKKTNKQAKKNNNKTKETYCRDLKHKPFTLMTNKTRLTDRDTATVIELRSIGRMNTKYLLSGTSSGIIIFRVLFSLCDTGISKQLLTSNCADIANFT